MDINTILIVDDEEINVQMLTSMLQQEGYATLAAKNGQEAWNILQESHQTITAILLDRMMPVMDGLKLLVKIKSDSRFNIIPVIMQTAMESEQAIREGMQAGAFYYLCKPYEKDTLLSIVRAAIKDMQRHQDIKKQLKVSEKTMQLMEISQFRFRTLEDCQALSSAIANACPQPEKVVCGLSELMINAVEHGNLNISYDDKSELVTSGQWHDEVISRLNSSKYASKVARIQFSRKQEHIKIVIKDQGPGFYWQKYIDLDPLRVFDCHGRGIAMANQLSFDKIQYVGQGNEVHCTIKL